MCLLVSQVRRPLKLMQVICLLIYGWTPRNRIDWKPEEGKEFDMPGVVLALHAYTVSIHSTRTSTSTRTAERKADANFGSSAVS